LWQARQRIKEAGLEDLVEVMLADFTDLQRAQRQVLLATPPNIITFSYVFLFAANRTAISFFFG
jgi:hypothetical protein